MEIVPVWTLIIRIIRHNTAFTKSKFTRKGKKYQNSLLFV